MKKQTKNNRNINKVETVANKPVYDLELIAGEELTILEAIEIKGGNVPPISQSPCTLNGNKCNSNNVAGCAC